MMGRYIIACFAVLGLCIPLINCSKIKRPMFKMTSSCEALECHASTPLMQSAPSSGKHEMHLSQGMICENCHGDYMNNPNHKNGIIDGAARNGADIVYFDAMNLSAKWDIGSRNCSSLECHGGSANQISWYDPTGGDCTVCHSAGSRIDPLTTNGLGIKGKHSAHVESAKIGCVTCHNGYKERSTHMNRLYGKAEPDTILSLGGTFNGMAVSAAFNNETGICAGTSCHGGSGEINWYSDSNGCTACHAPGSVYDPLTTNGTGDQGKHIAHVTRKGIECTVCHSGYKDNNNHLNGIYGKLESDPIVFYDSSNPSAVWDDATTTCNNMSCHGSVGWYVTGEIACVICHVSGNITGAVDPVITNSSGEYGKHVKHVSEKGFACTKCHNGYSALSSHADGVLDTVDPAVAITFFDSTNPSGAWSGDTGPRTGSCENLVCHGSSAIDWYGTTPWVLPDCTTTCHTAAVGSRRQVAGAGGDFTAESHHVINYATRTTQIVQNTDCKVCHDMSSHMGGSVRLKDKDTGSVIVYNPSSPNSLEPFCLSCHDTDGATTEGANAFKPFNTADPNTLGTAPNRAGIEIKGYWNKSNGHGKQGITCLGDGFTGCHGNYNTGTQTGSINAHGSDNVGLLSNKYTLPVPRSSSWDESRYRLCFECHASQPGIPSKEQLFGVADGGNYAQTLPNYGEWPYAAPDFMVTGFHDYCSYNNCNRQYNLHLYHLIEWMGQWLYRGVGPANFNLTCVSCHNVHGVDNQYFYLWDEWNFSIINDVSGIQYGKLADDVRYDYPDFCYQSCHWDGNYRYPRSPFNEAKAVASNGAGSSGSLDNGDIVTIYFSDSTNGPAINTGNINAVLALSGGHNWGGSINAVWSDSGGKSNNVLTITITDTTGSTIAIGDYITFDLSTITDTTIAANPIRGKMTLRGSF